MSRYIDADALHETLMTKQKWVVRCGDKHNEGYTYDQVHFAVDDAPSIDICFCRECKKANTEDCSLSYWDDDWGVWRIGYKGDEWYCADGEREGE